MSLHFKFVLLFLGLARWRLAVRPREVAEPKPPSGWTLLPSTKLCCSAQLDPQQLQKLVSAGSNMALTLIQIKTTSNYFKTFFSYGKNTFLFVTTYNFFSSLSLSLKYLVVYSLLYPVLKCLKSKLFCTKRRQKSKFKVLFTVSGIIGASPEMKPMSDTLSIPTRSMTAACSLCLWSSRTAEASTSTISVQLKPARSLTALLPLQILLSFPNNILC